MKNLNATRNLDVMKPAIAPSIKNCKPSICYLPGTQMGLFWHLRSAPVKIAPPRSALRKFASCRLAFVRFEPSSLALERSA